jgi:hypothetical protein
MKNISRNLTLQNPKPLCEKIPKSQKGMAEPGMAMTVHALVKDHENYITREALYVHTCRAIIFVYCTLLGPIPANPDTHINKFTYIIYSVCKAVRYTCKMYMAYKYT